MHIFDAIWHKYVNRPYNLAVTQAGDGDQPLVLIHGLAASARLWQPFIKRLNHQRWRIIAPDLLGFGDSPKPDWKQYSAEEHAAGVLRTLKRLRVGRQPVTIVAHSMGCLIAAHIAAIQPGRVRRLILYEPPFLGDLPDFPLYTKRSGRARTLYEFVARHPQLTFLESHLFWRVIRQLSGLHLSEAEWPPFERSLRNTIMDQQAYNELRHIAIPTDIVYGRLDVIVVQAEVEKLFRPNKHIRLHKVTDMHGLSKRSAAYLAQLLEGKKAGVYKTPRNP